ncbi:MULTISPECIES: ABC transporter substrate-binding protein [unclassified Bradyrhizobium]|uniref:ABC transporter substrate-binding protein n=1 Tax=unclassified Bradyrhizobium TaxID=2631580 RepID=UPI00188B19ED|nr:MULTISPECIES: ABC transporter substrate-binding protein [unclassified Bradyrhizobium]MDN4985186.1 ABC transporter substrate-binding protein [Bradyrhizobium sp. WYCCWR 13022]QOZ51349.1 ABC transporter substrate-binding protein [Bradyrhizobium sp. CCBAU 53338]
MTRLRSATRLVLISVLLAAIAFAARAGEVGVSDDAILFGQAAALEGPSSALGQRLRYGIVAAFTEINAKGGIHGRKLQLISRDDGYDPDRSVAQTLRLIDDDKVFALIGAVGTPTAMATIPITSARDIPFIGPFSGAKFLRDLELANVVNIRASYGAETETLIKHLVEDRHFTRIGIFYQDDSFGRDGLTGVKNALARRGLELAAEGTFERNTRAVGAAWRTIKRAEPEAIVMVGTYGPSAEFIKLAHRSGVYPTFANISFVGATALAKELGPDGEGVVVAQVVPFPWDRSIRLVADYQAAQSAFDPTLAPDFVSLEGYLSGRLAAAALEKTGPDPTRAGLLRTINEVGRFDISGSIVTVGVRAMETPPKVFLTVIRKDGTFKAIDRL